MKRLMMLLLAMMLCVPAACGEETPYWIDGKTSDLVHLRAAAQADADSLGLYYTGTDVRVLEWLDDWAYVQVGEVSGFMRSSYLSREQAALAGPWQMVNNPSSTWANLRLTPSMTGKIALCPDNGTAVQVLGETADGWSYVDCDGTKGYIRTSLLSPVKMAAQRTTILSQENVDSYIHQYIAPNGKPIYFSAVLREPIISFDDVNFDGNMDIVVLISSGVSNAYYAFFVYNPQSDAYERAFLLCGEEALRNYVLRPEQQIVVSQGSNGAAGALHETYLYRWQGHELTLIRSAVSEDLTVMEFDEHRFTTTLYDDLLHMTVRDHQQGGEGDILWEKTVPHEETEMMNALAEEEAALWQGI
ncbi:MAG: hypothetical protein PUC00_00885 [Clostridiales bacterium]|nr:hypothetical protein [Clostridiales bacterium]